MEFLDDQMEERRKQMATELDQTKQFDQMVINEIASFRKMVKISLFRSW